MAKRDLGRLKKTRDLMEELGIDTPYAKGILRSLWDVCGVLAPHGDIGQLSDKRIRDEIECKIKADRLIPALIRHRWLDEVPGYRLVCHNWAVHCEDWVHQKLKDWGQTFWDGSLPFDRKKKKLLEILNGDPALRREFFENHPSQLGLFLQSEGRIVKNGFFADARIEPSRDAVVLTKNLQDFSPSPSPPKPGPSEMDSNSSTGGSKGATGGSQANSSKGPGKRPSAGGKYEKHESARLLREWSVAVCEGDEAAFEMSEELLSRGIEHEAPTAREIEAWRKRHGYDRPGARAAVRG